MRWGFVIVVLAVLASGCTEVAYVRHADQKSITKGPDEENYGRQVDYYLGRAFFSTPPACVMVMPLRSKTLVPKIAAAVEETVGRHLTTRFDRVIDTHRVLVEARRRAHDPANPSDLRRLADALRCDAYAVVDGAGVDSIFAVIWTELSVSLGVAIKRASDGELLWRSRHRARRSDGAVPMSIFGAGAGTITAGRLAGDGDALPSIIDDSVRRMMASLPDVRKF
ncbi:MAG: hypothetical protein VW338_06790 [Rhodospirillaceae bacterium]